MTIQFNVYLYLGEPARVDKLIQRGLPGLYFRRGTSLIGMDTGVITEEERHRIVQEYKLRDFEVDQERFHALLKHLETTGGSLTDIELAFPERLGKDLGKSDKPLHSQSAFMVSSILKRGWNNECDVKSIEYVKDGIFIRCTALAELQITSTNNLNIEEVMNSFPIGILSSVIRC
ncbi:hypothetical protein [Paenibacillus polymyxa]|uniref:Uncharacterized protein n=1 Tax=Paenibacillus polymyxa (strain SC2) TaxID=886882 RepID=E3EK49_PAEPS|nr:hypothetical protein [Paenibacillus polymyxa]ADO59758.2 hypothetical protein PPSC2_26370 [Paenibacillus polymyxa SC2]WPQ60007.1 hypothetical protein SKN87_27575 [Paenibacillus polymyxa]